MSKTKKIIILIVITLTPIRGYGQVGVVNVDSGFTNLPELQGYMRPGYDFYNSDSDPDDDSPTLHGTVETQILSSSASSDEIQIIPLKVTGPNWEGDATVTDSALHYAAGLPEATVILKTTGAPGSIGAYQTLALNGKLVIINAGNNGAENPTVESQVVATLDGSGIIVGAVDGNNVIAPYSNRAGSFANFFLVSTGSTPYSVIQGTSFAAPKVAAVAARLLAASPELTIKEVVDILLRTAKDLGEPGTDQIYGRGALDEAAALAPIGDITLGGGSVGGGGAIIGAAIALALFQNSSALGEALIVDEFERVFVLDVAKRVVHRLSKPTHRQRLSLLVDNMGGDFDSMKRESISLGRNGFAYSSPSLDEGGSLSFGLNRIPHHFFDQRSSTTVALQSSSKTLSDHYLGFSSQGVFGSLKFSPKEHDLRVQLAKTDVSGPQGLNTIGVAVELEKHKNRSDYGISFGYMEESGSFFGGSSNGAFGVRRAITLSTGLFGQIDLDDHLHLGGRATFGLTSVEGRDGSVFSDFTLLGSQAISLYLDFDRLFSKGDRGWISLSQPIKVTSGEVDLTIPVSVDRRGKIVSKSERINFGSESAETLFEAYYHLSPVEMSDLALHLQLSNKEPKGGFTLVFRRQF